MSHKGIRLLIEDVVKSLGDDIQFTYARASDFNVIKDKRYPFITLYPLLSSGLFAIDGTYNFSKSWAITIAFYELDKKSSTQEEYALILDRTDKMVDELVTKINSQDDLLITAINQTPFIKDTADILTGYLLSMQITLEDNYNYCENC